MVCWSFHLNYEDKKEIMEVLEKIACFFSNSKKPHPKLGPRPNKIFFFREVSCTTKSNKQFKKKSKFKLNNLKNNFWI